MKQTYRMRKILILIGVGMMPMVVHAHVKWFSEFSFLDKPLSFTEAITPMLIVLAIGSAIAIMASVFIDTRLEDLTAYQRLREWLQAHRDYGTLILRIGMGMTFLLSWQTDTMLAPYLQAEPLIGWVQFVLVLFLLFPRTTPLAGLGTIILWFIGVQQFGIFYMLDYIAFVGIGVWLLLSQQKQARVRELGIPALYFTVGFALCWLAIEKIIYPNWGLEVLADNPQLTLGFPPELFLVGAAFVEFVLGYLLIIGLLGRPLSLVITLVFFLTTMIFGKVEIIGHTHLHAALLVFLLYGPGKYYPAPIDIHRKLSWRMAFAGVNFILLLAVFLGLFSVGANGTYLHTVTEVITPEHVASCESDPSTLLTINNEAVPCSTILDSLSEADLPTE